jgi:hypothetical protein
VNLHDNDLVPFGASAAERDRIVARFKAALRETGMVVPMATTNLFHHPVFKDGDFTANDPTLDGLRQLSEAGLIRRYLVIERGLAGPGLLAYVVSSKFANSLPPCRLESLFQRNGLGINRATRSVWRRDVAQIVKPSAT